MCVMHRSSKDTPGKGFSDLEPLTNLRGIDWIITCWREALRAPLPLRGAKAALRFIAAFKLLDSAFHADMNFNTLNDRV